jgi:hypothetical protein
MQHIDDLSTIKTMTLKEAAAYFGFHPDHFWRLRQKEAQLGNPWPQPVGVRERPADYPVAGIVAWARRRERRLFGAPAEGRQSA